MDSSLYQYKEKLKQALILVPTMSAESKSDAVKYWNDLAVQLQQIIFGTEINNFSTETLNQNPHVRVGTNTGIFSNSIIAQNVQGDTPMINYFSPPPSINTTLVTADTVECPRKSGLTQDTGSEQFDRGPKVYSPIDDFAPYYNPETALMIEGTTEISSYAATRSESFTLSERPLQQIQVFNQSSGSDPMDSPDSISAYTQLIDDIETEAQQLLFRDEPSEADIKKETINQGGSDKTITSSSAHTCEVCGKSGFSTKGNLKRHLRAHSGEKPFKCEYCESCFTEKKSLKIHVRRHTGEKPYKCQICGKLFSQTGVLQSHMALHLNERKFECNKCGKAFRQRSQLKLHLMRHDGVKRLECSTCMAKFLTKGDLERHCRIHTGERPYACKICSKTFTRQQSLNEHMNRHTGRKPYDCKFCDKTFSEMSACYKHAKVHKKQDQLQQATLTKSTPDYANPSG